MSSPYESKLRTLEASDKKAYGRLIDLKKAELKSFDEDIKNLPLECFWVAGLVQRIIRNHKSEHEVKPCRNAMFREIECLETDEQYGFFKSEHDVRPGHAIWIDKDEVERLFELFSEA